MGDSAAVRAEQLAKLTALLVETRRSGDASVLFRSRTVRGVLRLDEVSGPDDLPVALALGWFHWLRHWALPEGVGGPELRRAVDQFSPCFLAGVEDLPADLLPVLAREVAGPVRALIVQQERSNDLEALSSAVEMCRRVAAAGDEREHWYPDMLVTLASALHVLCERDRNATGMEEMVEVAERAAILGGPRHPCHPEALSLVGIGKLAEYRQRGHPMALLEAETVTRQAVALSAPGDLSRAGRLSNLSSIMKEQYHRSRILEYLQEAVTTARDAQAMVPVTFPAFPALSSNLAGVLISRFERTGRLADLDDAVAAARHAVQATPQGHPDRPLYLSNLAAALRSRFVRLGATGDIAEAREAAIKAYGTCPPEHPDHGRFLSISRAVGQIAYEHDGDVQHLELFAVTAFIALLATPGRCPEFAVRASELADVRRIQFEHNGSGGALREADEWSQRALDSSSAAAMNPEVVACRARVLRSRYGAHRVPADLDEAVDLARQAVDLATRDHTRRTDHLMYLADCLQLRAEHRGGRADAEQAAERWSEAARQDAAGPSQRIEAGFQAARTLAQLGWHVAAAVAAKSAVLLLPQASTRRLGRRDRQQVIGRYAGLASTAAALLLDASVPGDPRAAERAAGLLEAGRAVLLGQALEIRGDLAALEHARPELAARLRELREHLDQPEAAEASGWDRIQPGSGTDTRHHLNQELAELLESIRSMPGFTHFGVPPGPDELRTAAAEGPIVLVNVDRQRSDALLITQYGVRALPLPGLTPDIVARQVEVFDRALGRTVSDAGGGERAAMLAGVLEWLWDAVAGPVLTALGYTRTPVGADDPDTGEGAGWKSWPRIWWVPGGPLSALPLHAAGYHREQPIDPVRRRTVLDRVVSSYTPTVRALQYAREHARRLTAAGPLNSLIVAMPVTPGLGDDGRPLAADKEVSAIRRHLPGATVLRGPVPGSSPVGGLDIVPTRSNVLTRLPDSTVAHFACHGTTDPEDPSRSMLLLHDHATHPLTVAQLAPVALDHAQLAYLSACSTAVTHTDALTDEAIHLATAFQIAGYPRVVGTLWAIMDNIAVTTADLFYQALATEAGHIDLGRSARALHHAVRRIRDGHGLRPGLNRAGTPLLWAAHVHIGA